MRLGRCISGSLARYRQFHVTRPTPQKTGGVCAFCLNRRWNTSPFPYWELRQVIHGDFERFQMYIKMDTSRYSAIQSMQMELDEKRINV